MSLEIAVLVHDGMHVYLHIQMCPNFYSVQYLMLPFSGSISALSADPQAME